MKCQLFSNHRKMSFKKGTIYVFIANLINLVISLFTGFVLPKLLSIESYSNIKLFQLYIVYLGILTLGFGDGMYLRLGGKKIEELEKQEVLNEFKTFKYFQAVITIICIIISVLIQSKILLFCSIVILPVNIGSYLRNLYQATGKFDLYSKFMNINTILIFIINIFLVLIIKTDNYYFYISGYIIAYLIYWGYIEIETKKIFGKQKSIVKIEYLKNDIKSGMVLMLGNFGNVIFTTIDRVFVQNILGLIEFAYYSFAVSIENLLNVFITPISTVMYNYLCNNQEKEKVLNIKRIVLIFSAVIIFFAFPAKFIIESCINKYSDSIQIMFLLFISQYVSMMVRIIHINIFKAKKEQKKYLIIMIIIIIFSIISNIVFYNTLKSLESFAIATLITNIIWFMIGEIILKEYRLKLKDYIFFIFELIAFMLIGMKLTTILGAISYLILTIILAVILENSALKYLKDEILFIIKNKNIKK